MANAFKEWGPMILKYAEANAVNTSGAHNEGGLRPPLPNGAGGLRGIHYVPASIKNIGLRIF